MAMAAAALVAAWTAVTAATATFVTALTFGAGLMAGISAWTTVAMVGMGAALLAFPPKLPSQGQQVNIQMAGPDHPIPWVFGRTGTQGIITYRGTYGSNNDTLLVEHVLSGGPVDAIESFSVMGRGLSYSGNPSTGMATVTQVAGVNMKTSKLFRYDGLRVAHRVGSHTDNATLSQITGDGVPFISPNDSMPGLARTILRCKLDEKRLNFPNGYPDDPVTVLRGVKCYDPRLDSTRTDFGGSGPHRVNDASTHTWSENPFIVGLNFALGWWTPGRSKLFGLGMDIDMIDVASYVAAANVADANGWKVGGQVSSQDGDWQIMTNVLASGGGIPIDRAGKLSCFVRAPKVSTFVLKEADVLGGRKVSTTTSMSQRINRIIPVCRQENQKWEMISGEAIADPSWLAQDGGNVRTQEIQLPLVNSFTQAHQLAAYYACESREFLEFEVTAKPRALAVDVGDCIEATLPEFAAGQKWIVMSRKWDPASMQVTLLLKAETFAKHAFALGQSQVAPPPPTLTTFDPNRPLAPAATDWSVVDNKIIQERTETTTDEFGQPVEIVRQQAIIPALVIAGEVRDPNVDKVIIQYREPLTDEDVIPEDEDAIDFGWTTGTEAGRTATNFEITGLKPLTSFDVSVVYQTVTGAFSERLMLAQTTTAQDRAGGVGPGTVDWEEPDGDGPLINRPPVLTDLDGGRIKAQFVALAGDVTKTVQEALEDVEEATSNISTRIEDAWDILGESETQGLRKRVVALEVSGPDGTIVARIEGLESREEGVASRLLNVEQTQTTLTNGLATKAESSALTALSSVVNHPTSGLSATNSRLDTTNVEVGKRALTTSLDSLAAEVNTERGRLNGAINRLDSVDLEIDGLATVQSVNALSASLNTEKGRIDATNTRIDQVKITADGAATSSSVQQLTQTVNGHTNSISQISSVSTEANNRSKNIVGFVQNNGIVSGMRSENDGVRSRISFQQDVFEITPSAAGGAGLSFTGTEGLKLSLNGQTRIWLGFRNI